MSEPRKHHYVPQFYLAGFTRSGTKDGELYVFDLKRRKQWKSSPANVAHERDYYAIDTGVEADRNGVERAFSMVESECAAVVESIIRSGTLPRGRDFDVFLNFVAMMAVRVPHMRNTLNDFTGRIANHTVWHWFNTPDGRKQYEEAVRAQGRELSEDEYETTAKLYNEGAFTIGLDQTSNISYVLQMVDIILSLLAKRKWTLWFTADDAPDLICSDLPVLLSWTKRGAEAYSPAFGTANTTLSIPINRRIVAVSSFEGQPAFAAMPAVAVAAINALSVKFATQLYSADAEFVWRKHGKDIVNGAELFALLRQSTPKAPSKAPFPGI